MKGLSIEQKAKAYDKALGKAEDALNDGTISNNTIAYLQDIFPELKESEDEKIRKTLIRFHKSTIDVDGIKGEDIIAWLENLNLIKANSPQLGEQKTTDKVESKFKVGDWISGYYRYYKVLSINNDGYVVEDVDGDKINILFENEKFHHLFTITDAKGGDVLASGQLVFIFNVIHGVWLNCHCSVHNDGSLITDSYDLMTAKYFSEVHPATKKQRDTLEKAMTDAGYTFDFEKKELKKLGQSEVTKMSDQEEIAEIPFGAKDSELQEATYFIPKGFHAEIDDDKVVIKKGEKFAAWSVEDMSKVQRICKYLDEAKKYYADITEVRECMEWLKSLKQRIGG